MRSSGELTSSRLAVGGEWEGIVNHSANAALGVRILPEGRREVVCVGGREGIINSI
jgi:hypothetical protein